MPIKCLVTFLQYQAFKLICVASLCYVIHMAASKLGAAEQLHVLSHTASISQESLEITLCPVPRMNAIKLLHVGQYLNRRIYHENFENLLQYFNYYYPEYYMWEMFECLFKVQDVTPGNTFAEIMAALQNTLECWLSSNMGSLSDTFRYLSPVVESHVWQKLLQETNALYENLLQEMPMFEQMIQYYKFENMTLNDYMDQITLKLDRYMDEENIKLSVNDVTGPLHDFQQTNTIHTRFGRCMKRELRKSNDLGFQRSEMAISWKLRKEVMCDKEDLEECLPPYFPYIVMYFTAVNMFTDCTAAGTIVPYRVGLDQHSVMHISVRKNYREPPFCDNYEDPQSYTTCVEDCMMTRLYNEIDCLVPWIRRISDRFNATMPYCSTKAGLDATSASTIQIFDGSLDNHCATQCKPSCNKLTITSRLMGSTQAGDDATHGDLLLLITNELPVFYKKETFELDDFMDEIMGSISFIIGVSVVAMYDFLVGFTLWLIGRLPFIPAMPPLIKQEVYTDRTCGRSSCIRRARAPSRGAESPDDTVTPEGEQFLSKSFQSQYCRRTSLDRSSVGLPGASSLKSRRSIPAISVSSGALNVVASMVTAHNSDQVLAETGRSRTLLRHTSAAQRVVPRRATVASMDFASRGELLARKSSQPPPKRSSLTGHDSRVSDAPADRQAVQASRMELRTSRRELLTLTAAQRTGATPPTQAGQSVGRRETAVAPGRDMEQPSQARGRLPSIFAAAQDRDEGSAAPDEQQLQRLREDLLRLQAVTPTVAPGGSSSVLAGDQPTRHLMAYHTTPRRHSVAPNAKVEGSEDGPTARSLSEDMRDVGD